MRETRREERPVPVMASPVAFVVRVEVSLVPEAEAAAPVTEEALISEVMLVALPVLEAFAVWVAVRAGARELGPENYVLVE